MHAEKTQWIRTCVNCKYYMLVVKISQQNRVLMLVTINITSRWIQFIKRYWFLFKYFKIAFLWPWSRLKVSAKFMNWCNHSVLEPYECVNAMIVFRCSCEIAQIQIQIRCCKHWTNRNTIQPTFLRSFQKNNSKWQNTMQIVSARQYNFLNCENKI